MVIVVGLHFEGGTGIESPDEVFPGAQEGLVIDAASPDSHTSESIGAKDKARRAYAPSGSVSVRGDHCIYESDYAKRTEFAQLRSTKHSQLRLFSPTRPGISLTVSQ